VVQIVYYYDGEEKDETNQNCDLPKTDVIAGPLTEITIGRRTNSDKPDLDFCFDLKVSRRHAKVWKDNMGRYWIKDLGSKYGTHVDGVDIRGQGQVMLSLGIQIQVGNTKLWLEEDRVGPLLIKVTCLPEVNYSLIHAGIPFLSEVVVINQGTQPLVRGQLYLALSDYAEQVIPIPSIPAQDRVSFNPPPQMSFEPRMLRNLAAPETVPLKAWLNNEAVPLTEPVEVKILPPTAWHQKGYEATLVGFVMPNSQAINEIITRSRLPLQRLFKHVQGFADALEASNPDADNFDPSAIQKIMMAVYFCLEERYEITYEYEHPGDVAWQTIRFHDQIVAEKEGTCIDLALLFAACLENIHLNPLIIVVQIDAFTQHAFIGCWIQPVFLPSPLIRDEQQLRQWVKQGDILVIDSMGYVLSGEFPAKMRFGQCQYAGKRYINK